MRRRLYFMLDTVEQCQNLVTALQKQGVTLRQMHVLARDDVPLEGLHKATALEKTELKHGVEMGLAVGGAAGLLGGLLAVTFPPAGLVLAGEAILLATTLSGAGFGSLVSALVARDIPNHELEHFQRDITHGKLLLILDIPASIVDNISTLIRAYHPDTEIGITNPQQPFAQDAFAQDAKD